MKGTQWHRRFKQDSHKHVSVLAVATIVQTQSASTDFNKMSHSGESWRSYDLKERLLLKALFEIPGLLNNVF